MTGFSPEPIDDVEGIIFDLDAKLTGAFYATYDFGPANGTMRYTYDLTCKRTDPVF